MHGDRLASPEEGGLVEGEVGARSTGVGSYKLIRFGGAAGLLQDDGGLCLDAHRLGVQVTAYHRKEVAVSGFVGGGHLFIGYGKQIEVMQGRIRETGYLCPFVPVLRMFLYSSNAC